MWKNALCVCVFVVGLSYVSSVPPPTNMCPNAEDILPCRCAFPTYNLICENVGEVEELRKFAVNMQGTRSFNKLHLINSSLQYLPKELLENVNVYELRLNNVSLIKLFDEPPFSADYFRIITFLNVRLMRGVLWPVYKNMKNLQTLTINDISITSLGKVFKENVPHSLLQLEFMRTKTKKFEIGVFNDFKSLVKVDVSHGRLEELNRASFPVPFNVQTMIFGYNKLRTIPADLFTQMPMLKDIFLSGNQIAAVPQSAFGDRWNHLGSFFIQENPLKCDCSLKWIVISKPFWFEGTCASPKIMHGKELKSLTSYDFHC